MTRTSAARRVLGLTRDVIRRRRTVETSRAVAWAVGLSAGVVLGLAVADRVWALPVMVRGGAMVVLAGGVLWQVGRALLRAHGAGGDFASCRELERLAGLPRESLTVLAAHAQRLRAGTSGDMLEAHAGAMDAALQRAAVPEISARRHWVAAGAMVVALAGAVAVPGWRLPVAAMRVVFFLSPREAVAGVRISVEPRGADVVQGQPLRVTALVDNTDAPAVLESSRDGRNWGATEMSPRGTSMYVATLPPLQRDRFYRVRAGGAVSEEYHARTITTPAVRMAELVSPEGAATVLKDATLELVAGRTARLRLTVSEPLTAAQVVPAGAGKASIDENDRARVSVNLSTRPASDAELAARVTLRGLRGGVGEWTLAVRTVTDEPPFVEVARPLGETAVSPRDSIDVSLQAEDDLGLKDVEIVLAVSGREAAAEIVQPVAIAAGARRVTVSSRVALAPLALEAGQTVTLTVRARDLGAGGAAGAGQVSVSAPVTLRVVSRSAGPLAAARVEALDLSARRAGYLAWTLNRAADALATSAEADEDKREETTDLARLRMSAAAELVVALQRSLGRCARLSSSAEFADAMEAMTDETVATAAIADAVAPRVSSGDAGELTRWGQESRRLAGMMWRLEKSIVRVRRGEYASVLLTQPRPTTQFAATRPTTSPANPDPDLFLESQEVLAQAQQSGQAEIARWPLPEYSAVVFDLPPGVSRGEPPPIDGTGVEVVPTPLPIVGRLGDRLDAAWRVEMLRPDALPRRAADLALAARAATVLSRYDEPLPLLFGIYLRELDRLHAARRRDTAYERSADVDVTPEQMRDQLRAWAGPVGSSVEALSHFADEVETARLGQPTDRRASTVSVASPPPTTNATTRALPPYPDSSPTQRIMTALPEMSGFFDLFASSRNRRRVTTSSSTTQPTIDFDEQAVPPEYRAAVKAYLSRLKPE